MQLMRNKYINLVRVVQELDPQLLPTKPDPLANRTNYSQRLATDFFLQKLRSAGRISGLLSNSRNLNRLTHQFFQREVIDLANFWIFSGRSSRVLAENGWDIIGSGEISPNFNCFSKFSQRISGFFIFPWSDYHCFSDLQPRPIYPASVGAPTHPIWSTTLVAASWNFDHPI